MIPASFLLAHFGGELATQDLGGAMTVLLLAGLLVAVPLLFSLIHGRRRRGPVE